MAQLTLSLNIALLNDLDMLEPWGKKKEEKFGWILWPVRSESKVNS